MRDSLIALVATLAVTGSCARERRDVNNPRSTRTSQPGVAARPLPDEGDTTRLRQILALRGERLLEVLAVKGRHVAFVASAQGSTQGRMHLARLEGDSLSLLSAPYELASYDPFPKVQWLMLGTDSVDGVAFTLDNRAEGSVFTRVLNRDGPALREVFADKNPVCRPAELKDLDRDGRPELIAHETDAASGDCMSPCHQVLEERFDVQPAWINVYAWRGNWQGADSLFPSFYRDLAGRYERVAKWLAAAPDAQVCRDVYWAPSANMFEELARRAREMSLRPGH